MASKSPALPSSSYRKMNDDRKYYENNYLDFDQNLTNSFIDSKTFVVLDSFKDVLMSTAKEMMKEISESRKACDFSDTGCSIYTGVTGIAYVALFAGRRIDSKYTAFAESILNDACARLSGRRISFVNGDLGPLALSVIAFRKDEKKYRSLIDRMYSKLSEVKDPSSDVPDEILYGRSGFLYGMLYINKHLQNNLFSEADVKEVIQCIFLRGKLLARKKKSTVPLMYEWHDKCYLGAAHGTTGILYVLLHARAFLSKEDLTNLIRPTLDDLLSRRFPSGNLPSSCGNDSDRLVQWCHGAPGLVSLLTLASQVFEDQSYITAGEECCNDVWVRGLLRKGCGLCHGTGGNAYAFLSMYKFYKAKGLDVSAAKYLYQACAFTEWCLNYRAHRERLPDRPFSLFEGKSGILCLILDLLEPENAFFPAYDL